MTHQNAHFQKSLHAKDVNLGGKQSAGQPMMNPCLKLVIHALKLQIIPSNYKFIAQRNNFILSIYCRHSCPKINNLCLQITKLCHLSLHQTKSVLRIIPFVRVPLTLLLWHTWSTILILD